MGLGGRLTIEIGGRYPLPDAARAHRDLESRATIGKLLMLPCSQGRVTGCRPSDW